MDLHFRKFSILTILMLTALTIFSVVYRISAETSPKISGRSELTLVKLPVDYAEPESQASFVNKYKSVNITVTKTSEDDRVERKFKVTTANCSIYTEQNPIYATTKLVTDENGVPIKNSNGKIYGKAVVKNLPYAYLDDNGNTVNIEYKVEEVETPECYEQPKPKIVKPIIGKSNTVSFANTPKKGSIEIIKKAEVIGSMEIIPLPDITFELTNDYDPTFKQTDTTDADGKITFDNLQAAYITTDANGKETIKQITYTVHEIANTNNTAYVLADDKTVTIDYTGTDAAKRVAKAEILNKPIKGSVKLLKTDSLTNELLAGAKFRIWKDMDSNDVVSSTLDKNMGLMTETTVPVIDDNGNTVKDENGKVVRKGTGTHTMTNLPKGHYFLQERIAPAEHTRCKITFRFDIETDGEQAKIYYYKTSSDGKVVKDENGNPIKIYLENNSVPNESISGLTICKIDEDTKEPLADAEFTLYTDTACTKIHSKQITNEDGQITFSDLLYGTYYLVETKAPPGYIADRTPIQVVVDSDVVNLGEKYENNEIPNKYFRFRLPQTGGTAYLMYIVILLAVVLLIFGVVFICKSKKKQ